MLRCLNRFHDSGPNEENGIMMGHYFNFLLTVGQYLYFGFSCIFISVSGCKSNMSTGDIYSRNVCRTVGNLLFPTFSWFITKNRHHWLSPTVLVMAILSVPNQLAYFINLRSTGMLILQTWLICEGKLLTVLGTSALKKIHQWQITLLIFNGLGVVCKVFCDVAIAGEDMQDTIISACFTITISIFISSFLKNYMEEYVHPEKI